MSKIQTGDFYGLQLSSFRDEELIEFVKEAIDKDHQKILYGYSFGTLPYFTKYPEIAVYSNLFDVLVADGRGYYLFARLMGYPVKSDLSIPGMVNKILELGNREGYSIMLLGAKEEINNKASENLRNKYPGLTVYDGHHGYFKQPDEPEIVEFISAKKPNILLIGITSPMKERFAHKWQKATGCNIIIPCGGVIDILAGYKKQTPRLIKKMGLAWFYRFIQEPRRLFKDSILNSLSVLFGMIPALLLSRIRGGKTRFSIPGYYRDDYESVKQQILNQQN